MTNVKSLLEMYVKMGGSLTDTYADIAGGVPVGQYSTISDAILACSKKYSSGGGGGGAEKFVVTLTQENDTWTADKTIAEIAAADEANRVVVAKYPIEGAYIELPLSIAEATQDFAFALFSGLDTTEEAEPCIVSAYASIDGGDDEILVSRTPIPTSSNAPLIVTMTADQSTGNFVGDKTYKEVYDAFMAGQNCILNVPDAHAALAVLSVGHETGYTISASNEILASGSANDYVTITVGG